MNGRDEALDRMMLRRSENYLPAAHPELAHMSLYEISEIVVKELEALGEQVLRPDNIELWRDKRPDAYVKGAKSEEEMCIGTPNKSSKDGSYWILGEFLSWQAGPFKIGELGLCDRRCFYESEKTWEYIKKKRRESGGKDGTDM